MARVSTACILCQEKDLTDGCKKALALIFKICDMDNDGVMSDTGRLGKTFYYCKASLCIPLFYAVSPYLILLNTFNCHIVSVLYCA